MPLIVQTDSDTTSGSVYSAPPQPRRATGRVNPEPIHRCFIQRRFESDRSILAIRDDARPLVAKSNLVMCFGETVVGMVSFENVSTMSAYGIATGHAAITGAGQAVLTGPTEGAKDSWTVPTWSLLQEPLPDNEDENRETDIEVSLLNLRNLREQIQSLTPLSRSDTLVSLARQVQPSPPLSKGGIGRWARKLVKDITGAND